MRRSNRYAKILSTTIITSFLLLESTAWAGENAPLRTKLGYGFQPGPEPGKDFVTGEIIVGYRETADADAIIGTTRALGGKPEKTIPGTGRAILLNFGSEAKVEAAVRQLTKRPEVLFVERNGFMRTPPEPGLPDLRSRQRGSNGTSKATGHRISLQSVSADPVTGLQWHLTVIRKTATLPTLSATPPTIAVLGTGVDYTHPDLAGKVILGKNTVANDNDPFDDNGHGTHAAGVIAAKAANAAYGEGVCPNCKILAVKVLDATGKGTFFDIAAGMAYARTWTPPAGTPVMKIVTMSLVGPNSTLVATEVAALKTAGKVLVAPAGDGNTTNTTNAYPGADPNTALRVMATEQNDCRAWFSNFSPATASAQYNIAAPGWRVPSTVPDLDYASFDGTAMASSVVAGAAALVWGQLPTLTRDTLVARLLTYAQPISCGFAAATKRVDVRKAIYGTAETALVGRLLNPFTGKAPSPHTLPATARLYLGTTQQALDATNRGGFYEMMDLAAGAKTLKGDRVAAPIYVNATLRNPFTITAGKVNGPYTDALPVARSTGDATITLDWKSTQPIIDTTGCASACNGWEFDLAVKLPSGGYIDPHFSPGDLATAPYVKSPRDSYNDLEPIETIVIGGSAANGVYKVFVDNWPSGGSEYNDSWTNSLASVQVFNGATSIGTFYAAPPATCDLYEYWYLGNLTKSGTAYTWTGVNACSNVKP